MSTPSVCCLCLTADRQRFTHRAVKSFLSQTYANRWMAIYDTGAVPYGLLVGNPLVVTCYSQGSRGRAVGALRNEAIEMARGADIIAHWDSDDWSAPERIETQVRQLQMGGAAVGFHNLLFLDTRTWGDGHPVARLHAWEYDKHRGVHGTAIGTSLVYWRKTWERQPFNPNKMVGEDEEWHRLVKCVGFNGIGTNPPTGESKPLLIAEVHGGNTSGVYAVFDNHQPASQPEWRRAPEFDQYCRERLYP